MLEHRKREGGFTLVEMLLVLSIMGIIVMIAMATYVYAVANSRAIACHANQRVLGDAARVYTADQGTPPTDIDDLAPYVRKSGGLTRCPSDPTVELQWDPVREIVTCELHPTD